MIGLKYIELHAKMLVSDLATSWDETKVLELHETIQDLIEAKKISKSELHLKAVEVPCIPKPKVRSRAPYQPVGVRRTVVELILDLIESSVKNGQTQCHVKAKDFGFTDDWMERSVMKHINELIKKTGRYPNLRVSYRIDRNGGFWLFPKAKSL